MIYTRHKDLPQILEDNNYIQDQGAPLRTRFHKWSFHPNQDKNKLAITSHEKLNRNKVLIAMPLLDYKDKDKNLVEDMFYDIEQGLEFRLINPIPHLGVCATGALVGLPAKSITVSVIGAVAAEYLFLRGLTSTNYRNIRNQLRDEYDAECGNSAFKYLGIKL